MQQAAALAMAMPGAEQKGHFGNADFRVRNKIFASFPRQDRITMELDPEYA